MKYTLVPFLAGLASVAVAAPSAPTESSRYVEFRGEKEVNVFVREEANTKLSYTKNSGICETTPGVNQYSGYLSAGGDENLWFWFFEARNAPKDAPLVAWFGGGPGGSAEYGLFTQNGPCQFYNDSTEPSLNPYSFNNYANVLYIDQPFGSGFSYSAQNTTVNSTKTSSPWVWELLQTFYEAFPEYENRDFGVFSESYGGHTGTEIAHYILEQNAAIDSGDLEGQKINLKALSVSNGWFDATIQNKAMIDFAYENDYRSWINESYHSDMLAHYESEIVPNITECNEHPTAEKCFPAYLEYNTLFVDLFTEAINKFPGWNLGDVREDPQTPPMTHDDYLQRPEVQEALGAHVAYVDSGGATEIRYFGDDAVSYLSELSAVVQAGVNVMVWGGDTDWVCSWPGFSGVTDAVEWPKKQQFASKETEAYTVDGVEYGLFKAVDNLSFARIYEAGHNVMWYRK